MNALGLQQLKVVALAVDDLTRAQRFYGDTLELQPAIEGGRQVGYALGDVVLMLKSPAADDWPVRPTAQLNPRLTVETINAHETEHELLARGVTVADPVQAYEDDGAYVGSFLDSEGNKIWFCSQMPQA
jgi:catechol 2,3-dioxygenase-like lactoylglutathione lyase family enzyme